MIDEEITNFNPAEEEPKKRPNLLNVLLILSSIYIVFSLFSTVATISSGPLSEEQMEEQSALVYDSYNQLQSSGMDTSHEIKDMMNTMVANAEYINFQAFYSFHILGLFSLLIGAVGLFFMYKLRKIGFHLYVIYSLLPIITMYLVLPIHLIVTWSVIISIILSAIFAVLYGLNLKKME